MTALPPQFRAVLLSLMCFLNATYSEMSSTKSVTTAKGFNFTKGRLDKPLLKVEARPITWAFRSLIS